MKIAVRGAFKGVKVPKKYNQMLSWIHEYYHCKSLHKLGFVFDPKDYDPYFLEVFAFIEREVMSLESEEIKSRREAHKRCQKMRSLI